MKILILGAGQVGSSAAYHLSREEANEVTVVDMRSDILRELQDRLDIRTVVGHAAHPDVLERAGANDADIVVALTDTDDGRANLEGDPADAPLPRTFTPGWSIGEPKPMILRTSGGTS